MVKGKKKPESVEHVDELPIERAENAVAMSEILPPAKPVGGMAAGLQKEQEETEKEIKIIPPIPRSEQQRMGYAKY